MSDVVFNSIANKAPHLLSEWELGRNQISPMQVTYGSNKKYWWKCINGHVWEASPNNRFNGSNCPFCSNRKLSPENSLAVKCPHLTKEWHPHKNGKLTPYDVPSRGNIKVWWLCEKGHEWESATGNRYSGNGCPECSGRRPSITHNFAFKYPDLAVEWHPYKNGELNPNQVTPGSSRRVWWLCKNNHEWKNTIKDRARIREGCPYCSERKASKEFNLAVNHPGLLKEWHQDNIVLPNQVMPGSKLKVKWICKWGHEWEAQICSRARGHGCPKCRFTSSRLEVRIFCELKHLFNDTLWQHKIDKREVDIFIPSSFLGIEVDGWYWHKSDENMAADRRKEITLSKNNVHLIRVSDDRIKFNKDLDIVPYKKSENEYDIVARLLNLILTKNYLSCLHSKIKEYLISNEFKNDNEYNDIMSCLPGPLLNNSVASNLKLLNQWNYTKNHLLPTQVSIGSKVKVWWVCSAGHEWYSNVNSRDNGARGCPYCSGKKPSKENNLLALKPELAKEWHPSLNGSLTPDVVLPTSHKKAWWVCYKGHEWQATIGNRYYGAGCPECAGKKPTSAYNFSTTCPGLIPEWYYEKNIPLLPEHVLPMSGKKIWWKCELGHEWEAKIAKRSMGSGCPHCRKLKKKS